MNSNETLKNLAILLDIVQEIQDSVTTLDTLDLPLDDQITKKLQDIADDLTAEYHNLADRFIIQCLPSQSIN